MCGQPNGYLNYKNDRLNVLEDKEYLAAEEEPFHLKMKREQDEARAAAAAAAEEGEWLGSGSIRESLYHPEAGG